jgi:hypothetical protein
LDALREYWLVLGSVPAPLWAQAQVERPGAQALPLQLPVPVVARLPEQLLREPMLASALELKRSWLLPPPVLK